MIGKRTEEEWEESQKKNREHYKHACEKHPVFVQLFDLVDFKNTSTEKYIKMREWYLDNARKALKCQTQRGLCDGESILNCEIAEMLLETAKKDNGRAIEEARDCIAVLERFIDVLEGREPSVNK